VQKVFLYDLNLSHITCVTDRQTDDNHNIRSSVT